MTNLSFGTPFSYLANFQFLEDIFNNIIGSGVIRILEKFLYDPDPATIGCYSINLNLKLTFVLKLV